MKCLRPMLLSACSVLFLSISAIACAEPATVEGSLAAKRPETVMPVPRDEGWMMRQDGINQRVKEGNVDLIFVGDSITQAWENAGKEVWKTHYAKRNAVNLGIGGDRTQHVLWRLDHGNIDGISPNLAVIMIGTNNAGNSSPEDTAAGITAIVERLRTHLPETKILLLAIFPRGANSDDELRKVNMATNEIIKNLDDGKMIHFLDIGPKFLEADGSLSEKIMPDLLHLSPAGYQIWADAIEPSVHQLLDEK